LCRFGRSEPSALALTGKSIKAEPTLTFGADFFGIATAATDELADDGSGQKLLMVRAVRPVPRWCSTPEYPTTTRRCNARPTALRFAAQVLADNCTQTDKWLAPRCGQLRLLPERTLSLHRHACRAARSMQQQRRQGCCAGPVSFVRAPVYLAVSVFVSHPFDAVP
jgi:hypothetical protein